MIGSKRRYIIGFMFEKLAVCQKGRKFANKILDAFQQIPKGGASLVNQLRMAEISVLFDIAGGSLKGCNFPVLFPEKINEKYP